MSRLKGKMERAVNLELAACIDVLKLNSLHYGYWDRQEEGSLSLSDIREAQSRYTETLLDLIPEDVNTVLDVGCGVGDVSMALSDRGYEVTAISPHEDHRKLFLDSEDIEYHCVRFEKLDVNRKFDLILMSESQNYFDTDIGFAQCERYLADEGYLLVSGIFRKDDTPEFSNIPSIEKEYVLRAEDYNLTLLESHDITPNVLPTLGFAHNSYKEYVVPSLHILDALFSSLAPLKMKLVRLAFSREIRRLEALKTYYAERLDPHLFENYIRYLRLLFRIEKDGK